MQLNITIYIIIFKILIIYRESNENMHNPCFGFTVIQEKIFNLKYKLKIRIIS